MYVIAFANPKGGTGKTTAAIILAEQITMAGATVAILDCDPNQNIVTWGKERQSSDRTTPSRSFPGHTKMISYESSTILMASMIIC